jgi:hypothetical protein
MWANASPVDVIGIVCIVSAVVGGGVSLAGHAVPIINSKWRQAGVAAVGILLISPTVYTQFYGSFKIRAVDVDWDAGRSVQICSGFLNYTVNVDSRGAGDYQLRAITNGYAMSDITYFHAPSGGISTLTGSQGINIEVGQVVRYSIYIEIYSPNRSVSNTKYIDLWC